MEKWFPPNGRRKVKRKSNLVAFTLVFICASTVLSIKALKDWSKGARERRELGSPEEAAPGLGFSSNDLAFFGIQLAAGMANAVFINVLNFVYQRLARPSARKVSHSDN